MTPKPAPVPDAAADDTPRTNSFAVAEFKSVNTWGVRDSSGEWIRSCIPKREALRVFDNSPDAFQLIEGCDAWACLHDAVENLIVRKEKTLVLTPEGVPGT